MHPDQNQFSGEKSNSVCYHAVCESVTMGESLVGHIPSTENVTDLMTKVLYGHKRRYLVSFRSRLVSQGGSFRLVMMMIQFW